MKVRPDKTPFWDWRLPPALERDFRHDVMESVNAHLRPALVVFSVIVWGLLVVSPMYKTSFTVWDRVFVALELQLVIGLGFAATFAKDQLRQNLNYLTPVLVWMPFYVHMAYVVPELTPERQAGSQSVVVAFIIITYYFEPISPVLSLFTGIGASFINLYFRSKHGLLTDGIYFQTISHLLFANVIGVVMCWLQARRARMNYRLKIDVETEKHLTDRLLHRVFPDPVAKKLQRGEPVAETHPDVTVIFVDLVNFTPLASQLPARRLVDILNELFTTLDQLADKQGVEKIKMIGDAYMAVSGCPEPRTDHADRAAAFAQDVISAVDHFRVRSGYDIHVRIGMHSGPVVAGVIGEKRFAYDLWGDTVNIASRLESSGEAGKIRISGSTRELLSPGFSSSSGETISIKGKGDMVTYDLLPPARNKSLDASSIPVAEA